MSARVKLSAAVALAAACLAYGTSKPSVAARQPADEKVRYLTIDDNIIFQAQGTQAWKVRLPAASLAGKTSCVLKVQQAGRDAAPVLTERLDPNRDPAAALDITVVLHLGTTEYQTVKRVHLTLASDEFFGRRSMASPIEGFDGIGRDNEVGDPAAGLKLGSLSSSRDDSRVQYSLWVE